MLCLVQLVVVHVAQIQGAWRCTCQYADGLEAVYTVLSILVSLTLWLHLEEVCVHVAGNSSGKQGLASAWRAI